MSLNVFEYVNNLPADIRKGGDVIFKQGDTSDGRMYFVAEGELSVEREIDGQAHVLNRLRPGDFFGEMAILNKKPRSAKVEVTSRMARLGYLDEEMFVRIARINPVFHYSLLKLVIQRIGQIEDAIELAIDELNTLRGGYS
ncbi:MAG: cyclic nucleotide-binding domain-containing protein [Spirochaetales bacterium]|nr:cyclic nucleotide-binding domain-containing protein [Leptospiraceae bacterium]MCP5481621.1 cyclic nucleotide-binding domain-containing protein [Spirochaetales bacterium]MCP5484449.1 cyclic nucleotide-binding domain-containing protein [Spirochaetales bacterium]